MATQNPPARPNPVRIAVLEHDLFGVRPEPGTAAALAVGIRAVGQCWQHKPAATLAASPVTEAVCTQCGRRMELDDEGCWALV
ncbi:hypothetical protein ACFZAR_43875 [Streptomyces sp. NPDC008222]|uniref:hypothetical protein n=1 Tax=Streptomyces sp. NPDC008222 TaxID=3364820 RepID=UPI0036E9FCFD